ncbi:MAG TPA: hypothetical protein VF440_07315 [Novosphingobium sp.]
MERKANLLWDAECPYLAFAVGKLPYDPMMRKAETRIIYGVFAAILIALIIYVTLWIMGSAVVFDRSRNAVSAVIVGGDGATQPLAQLPGHIFYAVPQIEGSIEVRCRDGSRKRSGYVTGHMHTWLHIEPGAGCDESTVR